MAGLVSLRRKIMSAITVSSPKAAVKGGDDEARTSKILHLAAGGAVLPAVSRFASAQSYPTRPITMIVPTPPGGPTDAVGRVLVERMRASLRQP